MKAATLYRPWSWAIAERLKLVENRSWRPERGGLKVGQPFLIHAGQKYDADAANFIERTGGRRPPPDVACSTGIVAIARLVAVVTDPLNLPPALVPWFFGPVGWVMDDVVALKPFVCPGAQGLWDVSDRLLEQLEVQYPEDTDRLARLYLPASSSDRWKRVGEVRLPGSTRTAQLWNRHPENPTRKP